MCLFPLWTARVRPTMSGMTVELRDQVLMTFFVVSPPELSGLFSATFLRRTALYAKNVPCLLFPPRQNKAIAAQTRFSCLLTQSRFAPRGNRMFSPDARLTLTAAVGMIARIHHDTADFRTTTKMPLLAGFTHYEIFCGQGSRPARPWARQVIRIIRCSPDGIFTIA